MGRPKKNQPVEELDSENSEFIEAEMPNILPPAGIDISALVNEVKGKYKKSPGLANELVLGSEIVLSQNPNDYVWSEDIKKYWRPLTGILGSPFGRIIQIAGKPDSGKSTLAMLLMAAAQKNGVLVILWDAEKKFSVNRYEHRMGGNSKIIPTTRSKKIISGARQVAQYVRAAKDLNPDCKILIVWDSVGASLNSVEDDDEEDDYSKQPGVSAKEVSWAIKKFNNLIERYRDTKTGQETISIVCVNQTYSQIGSPGQKEKGGQELEYLSSLILQMTRKQDLHKQVKGQKMKYGIVTRAKVKKNHLFDGEECVAEMDLVVSSDGIRLKEEIKDLSVYGMDEE